MRVPARETQHDRKAKCSPTNAPSAATRHAQRRTMPADGWASSTRQRSARRPRRRRKRGEESPLPDLRSAPSSAAQLSLRSYSSRSRARSGCWWRECRVRARRRKRHERSGAARSACRLRSGAEQHRVREWRKAGRVSRRSRRRENGSARRCEQASPRAQPRRCRRRPTCGGGPVSHR